MELNYQSELDVSPILDEDNANDCQSQLGILRWIVELGCINILATEVSMLTAHNALPQEGQAHALITHRRNTHSLEQCIHCVVH